MTKNALLIIIFILFSRIESKAYIPTCFKGHFYIYSYNAGLGHNIRSYLSIQCDTTINTKLYHKVLNCDTNGNNTSYRGAIREDTLTQKVYYIASDSLQERLVFDFSLQPNDTFLYATPNGYKTLHVDSISIKYLLGQNRKIIYFDSLSPFVEGVGSIIWGILDRPLYSTGPLGATALENTLNVPEQCYPTEVTDFSYLNNLFIIYPNPVHNELYIRQMFYTETQNLFSLTDIQGQVILKGILNKNQIIPFQMLNNGLYILHIKTNDKNYYYHINKE